MKDYEYVIFGGNDPEMRIGGALRRMLPIDVQVALRDAEKDLASWRNSPLRPLIEDLAASLDDDAREEIQNQVDQAQRELAGHEEVVATAERISERLIAIAGGNMLSRYRSDLHLHEWMHCCVAFGCLSTTVFAVSAMPA